MRSQSSRLLRPTIALFAVAFTLWCMGCAKIADPQPPEIRIPKPATDLAARQVSDCILLSVSMPSQNTNGSQVSTLQKINVYRFSADKHPALSEPLSDAEFLKKALPILSIPAASFASYLHNGTLLIRDRIQPIVEASISFDEFQYAVLFVNNKNQAAGLSNRARINLIPIPPPPEGLSATVMERSIELKWNVPLQSMDGSKQSRIAGYNIYRSEKKDPFQTPPINSAPVDKAEYEDSSFEFGKTYYYAVQIIVSLQNPRAESLPSEAIEVTARDTFPPSPPKDFKALLEGETIILLWAPSLSTDVAGYKIYRQEKESPARQLLQSKLIPSWSFRDKDLVPGKSYEYSILAVDLSGNESEAAQATVEIP
jgi:hypothetical protein